MIMTTGKKNNRRHLLTALGALSILTLLKLPSLPLKRKPIACAPPPKTDAAGPRLLTRDGRLVEVDPTKISVVKKKVSDEELKNWINHVHL